MATWGDIKQILDDAMKYEVASACIPAAYVKQAAEYVQGKLAICTVIGFPNGYSTMATKVLRLGMLWTMGPMKLIWLSTLAF